MCSPLSPSTSHTHHHLQEHSPDANPDPSQDHATDEEKLASSTNQKWTRHDVEVELTSDPQDFPQPTDFTAFVNENSLPAQSDGERGEESLNITNIIYNHESRIVVMLLHYLDIILKSILY